MNCSMSPNSGPTHSGGGGTKAVLPGRVPPTQFCERHSSPGCLPEPRTPSVHQQSVRITEQPQTDGQARPVAQEPLHQLAGAQLAGDLFHIVDAVKGSRIPVTRERRLLAQTGRSNVEIDRPPPQQCIAAPRQPQRRADGGGYGVPTTEGCATDSCEGHFA